MTAASCLSVEIAISTAFKAHCSDNDDRQYDDQVNSKLHLNSEKLCLACPHDDRQHEREVGEAPFSFRFS